MSFFKDIAGSTDKIKKLYYTAIDIIPIFLYSREIFRHKC